MKYLFITSLLFIISSCTTKDKDQYHFKANIENITENANVLLFNYDIMKVVDSTTVKDGIIEFKGTTKYPFEAAIRVVEDTLTVLFWMEHNKVTLNTSKEIAKKLGLNYNLEVRGGKINEALKQYTNKIKPFHKRYTDLYNNNKDTLNKKQKLNQLLNKQIDASYDFFIDNPNNYFSLDELIKLKHNYSKELLENYYNKLSKDLQQSPKGKLLKDYILSSGVQIGDLAPNIITKDLQGKTVKLSDFKGKYVLLNFWAAWCSPCVKKMQQFPELEKKYKDKDLVVFNFSFDVGHEEWKSMSEQLQLKSINTSNLKNMSRSKTAFNYGVESIPSGFIISPEGKIIKHINFDDNLFEEVKKLIK